MRSKYKYSLSREYAHKYDTKASILLFLCSSYLWSVPFLNAQRDVRDSSKDRASTRNVCGREKRARFSIKMAMAIRERVHSTTIPGHSWIERKRERERGKQSREWKKTMSLNDRVRERLLVLSGEGEKTVRRSAESLTASNDSNEMFRWFRAN